MRDREAVSGKGRSDVPTYDYECEACKGRFEIFHPMSETRKKCPKCGASRLKRLFGPGSGFIFRGSGFYITDYRNSDYKSKAKAESEGAKGPSSGSDKPADKPAGSAASSTSGSAEKKKDSSSSS
jgi:putative FmdB family regulatory protein